VGEKTIDPERYGMTVCRRCDSRGYMLEPSRHCCPECRGFGLIKKAAETDILMPKIPPMPEFAWMPKV
jgi:DnaJ-class molecular chaperone